MKTVKDWEDPPWKCQGFDMRDLKWEGGASWGPRRQRSPWPPPFSGNPCLFVECEVKHGSSWEGWTSLDQVLQPPTSGGTMLSNYREDGLNREERTHSVPFKGDQYWEEGISRWTRRDQTKWKWKYRSISKVYICVSILFCSILLVFQCLFLVNKRIRTPYN